MVVDLEGTDTSRQPGLKYRVVALCANEDSASDDIQVQTRVLWAPHDENDVGRQHLVEALSAIADGRSLDAIVPANIAVELTLGESIAQYYRWIGIGNERVKTFLRDAATYSHQLNVVAPGLAAHLGAPRLDGRIVGSLNRLRDLRNDAAHRGSLNADDNDIAEAVVAAVFGFRYATLLGELVRAKQAGQQGNERRQRA